MKNNNFVLLNSVLAMNFFLIIFISGLLNGNLKHKVQQVPLLQVSFR